MTGADKDYDSDNCGEEPKVPISDESVSLSDLEQDEDRQPQQQQHAQSQQHAQQQQQPHQKRQPRHTIPYIPSSSSAAALPTISPAAMSTSSSAHTAERPRKRKRSSRDERGQGMANNVPFHPPPPQPVLPVGALRGGLEKACRGWRGGAVSIKVEEDTVTTWQKSETTERSIAMVHAVTAVTADELGALGGPGRGRLEDKVKKPYHKMLAIIDVGDENAAKHTKKHTDKWRDLAFVVLNKL
ncbi:hypothetical protein DL771_000107 [Monosporascus sp. 5C6A]|nr:hypothetical protein DL771_000107 [Monosporascus sp. 5C6A]